MAGKGFNIGVAGDAQPFAKAIKAGIIEPLEDAEDALKDLGKTRGLDQVERGMKDAQEATERLKAETKETADAIDKEFRRSYAEAKRASADATDSAAEDMETIKKEGVANLSEVASSFDGSVESVGDLVQGTLGGIVADLGPLGMALGTAGAVGVGLVMAAFDQAGQHSEAFKEKVAEVATELIEAGASGSVSVEYIVDKLKELATETDDAATGLTDLRRAADNSGHSFEDLAQAYAGNVDGINDMIAAIESEVDALDKKNVYTEESSKKIVDAYTAETDALDKKNVYTEQSTKVAADAYYADLNRAAGLDEYSKYLTQAADAATAAAEAEANYAAAGGYAAEARVGQIAMIDAAYDEAASASSGFVDAEAKIFDVEGYIASMQARQDALDNYQTSIAASGLTPEAIAHLNEQGVESAAVMLAGYESAAPAQKTELNRIWTEAGGENSGAYLTEAQGKLSAGKLDAPSIVAKAPSMSPIISAMQTALNQSNLTVTVTTVDQKGVPLP